MSISKARYSDQCWILLVTISLPRRKFRDFYFFLVIGNVDFTCQADKSTGRWMQSPVVHISHQHELPEIT